MELHERTRFCLVLLGTLLSFFSVNYECIKLDGYEFPVYATEFCPGNQTEWNKRSSAINCNETNGYVCLPNENFTELLEFCYIHPFILIQEDICLYLHKRYSRVYSYNCQHFWSGCPTSSFISNKLFEYPSCSSIRNGCFLADKSCTGAHLQGSLELNNMENITVNSSIDRRPTGNHNQTFKKIEWKILASFLGAFTPIFVLSVLCIYHKHKHGISDHLTNKRNCNEKSIEEEQLCHLLNDDQQQETKQVDEECYTVKRNNENIAHQKNVMHVSALPEKQIHMRKSITKGSEAKKVLLSPKVECCKMKRVSKSTKIIVAAIDFGTTYSGFAFSLKYDWGKVISYTWNGGYIVSNKTPTCLLIKKDFSEFFFGYEAEDKYSDLTTNDFHHDFYFFQQFKMILHQDDNVKRYLSFNDITGETIEAAIVFEYSIRYLLKCLHHQINRNYVGINSEDIAFVVTVPAIWGDKAKMFMREAAIKAGINKDNLAIALEPEAASIYCQSLSFAKENTSYPSLSDTKYMVVDLGGGTADITVHQKCENNTLEEVIPASGGPWGGKAVDDQFIKFLSELVGENVLEEFKRENVEDYLEITRSFDRKKRTIKPNLNGTTRMPIPQTLVTLCIKSHGVNKFQEIIEKNSLHKKNVSFAHGKLRWNNSFFRGFFKKSVNGIVKHIDELFQTNEAKDVKIIVMVGGFSDCSLVVNAIRENFRKVRIIVPEEAGMAVLKGAVYFGHIPDVISRRSARFTYGIQTWPVFNDSIHPKEKMVQSGNSRRCRDVFYKVVTLGEKVMPGYERSNMFEALHNSKNVLECGVFVSDKKDPKFVDDPGCRLLGILTVPLSQEQQGGKVFIEETLIFGETELKFKAYDTNSGLKCEATFDLLKD